MFCFETHMQNLFLVPTLCFLCLGFANLALLIKIQCFLNVLSNILAWRLHSSFQLRISVLFFLILYKLNTFVFSLLLYYSNPHLRVQLVGPCFEGENFCSRTYYCSNSIMLGNLRDLGFTDLTFLLKMQQHALDMEFSVFYIRILILLSLLQ
jgi:hypothetical protein